MKKLLSILTVLCLMSLGLFAVTGCVQPSRETYRLLIRYYDETGADHWSGALEERYIKEGEPIGDITPANLPGCEFAGWDIEIPSVMPSSNLTITAKYNVVTAPESIFIVEDGVITGLTPEGQEYYAIKMPDTINGETITEIGTYAFGGGSVAIACRIFEMADTVTVLGSQAFTPCDNLKQIKLSEHITEIPYHCFSGGAFESIEIPSSVEKLSAGAFNDCDKLTEIVIPETVLTVVATAFSGCDGITSITIPKNTQIETNAYYQDVFGNMPALKEIKVDENNPYYTSKNGLLFSKDEKTLIRYCPAIEDIDYNVSCEVIAPYAFRDSVYLETINFGASVKEIGTGAFFKCAKLKTFGGYMGDGYFTDYPNDVLYYQPGNGLQDYDFIALTPNATTPNYYLKQGVKKIRRYGFSYNQALLSVVIPNTIEKLEYGAFYYCDNLSVIEYQGTVEEWKAVKKDTGWYLSNQMKVKVVNCVDGTVNI